MAEDTRATITMTVGNTAELQRKVMTRDPVWAWRVYVEAAEHALLIDKISLQLHPTFQVVSRFFGSAKSRGWELLSRGTGVLPRDVC